jgi:phage-related tail fiber protein
MLVADVWWVVRPALGRWKLTTQEAEMKWLHRTLAGAAGVAVLGLSVTGVAVAGQPGVSAGNECRVTSGALLTPGKSISAGGSPFNPNGQAGTVYAGNPETASLEHAGSKHAVSQYDIACVQVSK